MEFGTVRPDVICSNGCVACSQPLAAQIGLGEYIIFGDQSLCVISVYLRMKWMRKLLQKHYILKMVVYVSFANLTLEKIRLVII